jgi:hypothetical protein
MRKKEEREQKKGEQQKENNKNNPCKNSTCRVVHAGKFSKEGSNCGVGNRTLELESPSQTAYALRGGLDADVDLSDVCCWADQ